MNAFDKLYSPSFLNFDSCQIPILSSSLISVTKEHFLLSWFLPKVLALVRKTCWDRRWISWCFFLKSENQEKKIMITIWKSISGCDWRVHMKTKMNKWYKMNQNMFYLPGQKCTSKRNRRNYCFSCFKTEFFWHCWWFDMQPSPEKAAKKNKKKTSLLN